MGILSRVTDDLIPPNSPHEQIFELCSKAQVVVAASSGRKDAGLWVQSHISLLEGSTLLGIAPPRGGSWPPLPPDPRGRLVRLRFRAGGRFQEHCGVRPVRLPQRLRRNSG